jgi:hypothetical protein
MHKRWHYLYVIVYPSLGYKLYYGSRVSTAHPDDDIGYFGSSITFARYNDTEHAEYQADALKVVLWAKHQAHGKSSNAALATAESLLIKTAIEEHGLETCLNRNIGGRIYLAPEEQARAFELSQANGGGFSGMSPEDWLKTCADGGKKAARLKKGIHGMTPAQRKAAMAKGHAAITEKYSKTYTFRTPYGKEITITNLSEFCRLHHLSACHMRSLNAGRINSHKGWRRPE